MSPVILQTFHKEFLHNPMCDWIRPIGVNGFFSPAFLNDNTGDHISDLNSYYCELTAQYWAWKNFKADHVGFYHYRRYLNFLPEPGFHENTSVDTENAANAIAFLSTDAQKAALEKMLSICDVVTAQRSHLIPSVEAQYCGVVENAPWLAFLAELKNRFPGAVDPQTYFQVVSALPICNMYVMKKPLFDRYCEDLFAVIDPVFQKIGAPYNAYNNRYPGFLAERFLGYWLHIHNICAIEVPMIVIK
jgi:Domain of unknown function (DUF4422)